MIAEGFHIQKHDPREEALYKHRARFYAILNKLPQDARLVIHCTAGKGRFSMMLAIALVHKYGYTPAHAPRDGSLTGFADTADRPPRKEAERRCMVQSSRATPASRWSRSR